MTHDLHLLMAAERTREIERRAELARRNGSNRRAPDREASPAAGADLMIRTATPDDAAAVERLAQLEGREAHTPLLLAEVDGHVVAALSLADGDVLSDPFRPTTAVLALMRLRASQLGGHAARRRRRTGTIARIRSALRWSERAAGPAARAPGPPDSGPSLVR
jgi:hypothetical protein